MDEVPFFCEGTDCAQGSIYGLPFQEYDFDVPQYFTTGDLYVQNAAFADMLSLVHILYRYISNASETIADRNKNQCALF